MEPPKMNPSSLTKNGSRSIGISLPRSLVASDRPILSPSIPGISPRTSKIDRFLMNNSLKSALLLTALSLLLLSLTSCLTLTSPISASDLCPCTRSLVLSTTSNPHGR